MVCYLDHAACSVGVGNSMLPLPVLWEECVKNWVVNDLLSFTWRWPTQVETCCTFYVATSRHNKEYCAYR